MVLRGRKAGQLCAAQGVYAPGMLKVSGKFMKLFLMLFPTIACCMVICVCLVAFRGSGEQEPKLEKKISYDFDDD